MGSTWDFFHRKVFENHPATQALRVPESDGKLRERSFFQVRTWGNERCHISTPQRLTGNGHMVFGDPNPVAGETFLGSGQSVSRVVQSTDSEARLTGL